MLIQVIVVVQVEDQSYTDSEYNKINDDLALVVK